MLVKKSKKGPVYGSRNEVKSVWNEVWEATKQEDIEKWCTSGVANRLKKCIAVNGHSTKGYSKKQHGHLLPTQWDMPAQWDDNPNSAILSELEWEDI